MGIEMDIVSSLEKSAAGYRFVLLVVGYATQSPEAILLCSMNAKAVGAKLMNIFPWAEVPRQIIMDQGTNVMSQTMKQLCQLKIKTLRTSFHHPQIDSLVKRFIRTLKTMLRSLSLQMSNTGTSCSLLSCLPYKRYHSPPPASHHSNCCRGGNHERFWTSFEKCGKKKHLEPIT